MPPGGPSSRLTLGRGQRLIRPGDFARLRAQGQRLALGCLVANWVALQPPQCSRLGVVTSKKVGGAVVRNRARRLLRDVFRQHQHDLVQPVELVLVARPSIAALRRPQVERDYLAALRRARLLRQPDGAPAV